MTLDTWVTVSDAFRASVCSYIFGMLTGAGVALLAVSSQAAKRKPLFPPLPSGTRRAVASRHGAKE